MSGANQERKYVTLTEALSWIAFRTLMSAAEIKERLRSDPTAWETLEDAMQQFSVTAGDGRLRTRGRFVTDVDDSDQTKAKYTDDIPENLFSDLQQFDLDRERLQYRPPNGSRVLGTWGVPTPVRDLKGQVVRTETNWFGKAEEYSARTFQSYAGIKEENQPSHAAGYEKVEVTRVDLLQQFPNSAAASKARGRPPELDHDTVRARAKELREEQLDLSIGAAAASLSAEFGPNPKTAKSWDTRGIERIIAPLWSSREDK